MQERKQRDQNFECPLLGFVMKHKHAEESADGAEQDRAPKQHFFGNSPVTADGFSFVHAKEKKGEDANDKRKHEEKDHHVEASVSV